MRRRRAPTWPARASGGVRRADWAPRGGGTGIGPRRLPSAWRKWAGRAPSVSGRGARRPGGAAWLVARGGSPVLLGTPSSEGSGCELGRPGTPVAGVRGEGTGEQPVAPHIGEGAVGSGRWRPEAGGVMGRRLKGRQGWGGVAGLGWRWELWVGGFQVLGGGAGGARRNGSSALAFVENPFSQGV